MGSRYRSPRAHILQPVSEAQNENVDFHINVFGDTDKEMHISLSVVRIDLLS